MVKGYIINESKKLEEIEVPKGMIGKIRGFEMVYATPQEAFDGVISNQEYALRNEEYKVKLRKEIIEKLKAEKDRYIG